MLQNSDESGREPDRAEVEDSVLAAFMAEVDQAMPFLWSDVPATAIAAALASMFHAGLSMSFYPSAQGRVCVCRVSDLDGTTSFYTTTPDELTVLLKGLATSEAGAWIRGRLTPYPRGGRRR